MAAILWCVAVLGKQPPSPVSGKVTDNVYISDFFRFSYPLPSGWSVRTDEMRAQAAPATGNYILLLVTKSAPGQPLGSTAVVVTGQEYSGTAGQYLEELRSRIKDAQASTAKLQEGGGGFVSWFFDRQDFQAADGHYFSYVVTLLRNYVLSFTIHADSPEELENLVKTVSAAKFTPDYSNGAAFGAGCDAPRTDEKGRPVPQQVRVSQTTSEGLLVKKVPPRYPEGARQLGIRGTVILRGVIGCDGSIRELFVVSGSPLLAAAALDAVKQWKYKPYVLLGRPVEVATQITVNFTLTPR